MSSITSPAGRRAHTHRRPLVSRVPKPDARTSRLSDKSAANAEPITFRSEHKEPVGMDTYNASNEYERDERCSASPHPVSVACTHLHVDASKVLRRLARILLNHQHGQDLAAATRRTCLVNAAAQTRRHKETPGAGGTTPHHAPASWSCAARSQPSRCASRSVRAVGSLRDVPSSPAPAS